MRKKTPVPGSVNTQLDKRDYGVYIDIVDMVVLLFYREE